MKIRWIVASGAAALLLVGGVWLIASPQGPSEQSARSSAPAPQTPRQLPAAAAKRAIVAPTIGVPTAMPAIITVNAPTTVTVCVQINPAPLPGGVNLLRLGASGTQPTILGVLHDDGLNGDSVAGDNIYTLQVNFNEPTAGQIQLQVSAAFKGLLKRALTGPVIVPVWNAFSPAAGAVAFTVAYPSGWTSSTSSDNPNEDYFAPSSSPPSLDQEYVADIVVDAFSNASGIDLPTYYSTLSDINWYLNSESHLAFTTAVGFPAVEFFNVASMVPSDVVAVHTGRTIIQIFDVGQQHGSDGILQTMVNSVR